MAVGGLLGGEVVEHHEYDCVAPVGAGLLDVLLQHLRPRVGQVRVAPPPGALPGQSEVVVVLVSGLVDTVWIFLYNYRKMEQEKVQQKTQ